MNVYYKIDSPNNFSIEEKTIFLELLKQQGKVNNPTIEKVIRCSLLCVCKVNNLIVSIGAIKPKTSSDFNREKANIEEFRNKIKIELGYCYTLPLYRGNGFLSVIVRQLIDKVGNSNLMASTELSEDNSMKRILDRNNFSQKGNAWSSGIHGGQLGLFLRFAH